MSSDVRERVIEALKRVYDPEIPINIYDLGLVYEVRVEDRRIYVELGVTTPLCPLANVLPIYVEQQLRKEFPDYEIDVRVNLEKPWSPERMTEEGRKRFRELFGYDPLQR